MPVANRKRVSRLSRARRARGEERVCVRPNNDRNQFMKASPVQVLDAGVCPGTSYIMIETKQVKVWPFLRSGVPKRGSGPGILEVRSPFRNGLYRREMSSTINQRLVPVIESDT